MNVKKLFGIREGYVPIGNKIGLYNQMLEIRKMLV